MERDNHASRKFTLRVPTIIIFYLCALMLLLDVATTAVGIRMGGFESNAISAGIIYRYGLAGFELVKIPGVGIFVAMTALAIFKWSKMRPVEKYAFIAVAFFGLVLTAAPVASNLLGILLRT